MSVEPESSVAEIIVVDGYSAAAVGPLLLGTLVSIHQSISCLQDHLTGVDIIKGVNTLGQLRATYSIARGEVERTVSLFEDCPLAIIEPNHQRCLTIIRCYTKTIAEQEDVMALKWHRRKKWDRFVHGLLRFIDDAYICLRVDTSEEEGAEILAGYVD